MNLSPQIPKQQRVRNTILFPVTLLNFHLYTTMATTTTTTTITTHST